MKKVGLFIIMLVVASLSYSQDDDNYVYGDNTPKNTPKTSGGGFDWSRLTVGGGFGMTFGDYTIIDV